MASGEQMLNHLGLQALEGRMAENVTENRLRVGRHHGAKCSSRLGGNSAHELENGGRQLLRWKAATDPLAEIRQRIATSGCRLIAGVEHILPPCDGWIVRRTPRAAMQPLHVADLEASVTGFSSRTL